jgi:hypothetical protein
MIRVVIARDRPAGRNRIRAHRVGDRDQVGQLPGLLMGQLPGPGLGQRHQIRIGQAGPVGGGQDGGQLRAGWHHLDVLRQPLSPAHVYDPSHTPRQNEDPKLAGGEEIYSGITFAFATRRTCQPPWKGRVAPMANPQNRPLQTSAGLGCLTPRPARPGLVR